MMPLKKLRFFENEKYKCGACGHLFSKPKTSFHPRKVKWYESRYRCYQCPGCHLFVPLKNHPSDTWLNQAIVICGTLFNFGGLQFVDSKWLRTVAWGIIIGLAILIWLQQRKKTIVLPRGTSSPHPNSHL
jgi:hypothetical protein